MIGQTAQPDDTASSGRPGDSPTSLRLTLNVFLQNRLALSGIVVVSALALFSFIGPLVYHTNQIGTDLALSNQSPSSKHFLGTDNVGYDVLGRLMTGGQTTFTVGVIVALLATCFGVIWGAAAGFAGGALDALMMRVVDALLAIPALFLLLFLASIFQPSEPLLILVIASVAWLVPSRLIRAEALTLKTRDFVAAAQSEGAGSMRIVVRHILPNTISTVVVNATFQVADATLTVAALSFLGLGIPPPSANWGSMLSNGVNYVFEGYWWEVWPAGLCIVSLVVAFNFIGDGLRDAFEVRLRQR